MHDTVKIRVTARVIEWLRGTQVATDAIAARRSGRDAGPVLAALGLGYWAPLLFGPSRRDGSVTLTLTRAQAADLAEWASYLVAAAAGDSDPSALAELNAARGLIRRVHQALAVTQ